MAFWLNSGSYDNSEYNNNIIYNIFMYIPTYIPAGIAVFVYGVVCRDTLIPRGSRRQRVFVPIFYV